MKLHLEISKKYNQADKTGMAVHWEEELKELCSTGCPQKQAIFMLPI